MLKEDKWDWLEILINMIFNNNCSCPDFGCISCPIYKYSHYNCLDVIVPLIPINMFKDERTALIKLHRKRMAINILIKEFPFLKEDVEAYFFEENL